jgi:hypothetical protein
MKKLRNVLIILVVLSILYGQRENIISLFDNKEEVVFKNEVINTGIDTSKVKDAALRKELAGYYKVIYYNADQGGQETYTLHFNGACTWAYMGNYKKGYYTIIKGSILTMTLRGNTGLIVETFERDKYGRWSKGNAYLSKVEK